MNNQTGVVCPRNSAWLAKMLEVLPPGLRGKLAPYEGCQIKNLLALDDTVHGSGMILAGLLDRLPLLVWKRKRLPE